MQSTTGIRIARSKAMLMSGSMLASLMMVAPSLAQA